MYRDYGLVPPSALTPALAQHLRDQNLIDKNRLVEIRLYQDIAIKINPPDLELYAFQAGENLHHMEGIEAWEEKTFGVMDSADEITSRIPSSGYLSEVMNGEMMCYFLYDVVRTSLGWILKRYEGSGKSAPSDLYRKHQGAEENRAWIAGVLEFSGRQLITIPPTQVAIKLRMTNQTPTVARHASALCSGFSGSQLCSGCFHLTRLLVA